MEGARRVLLAFFLIFVVFTINAGGSGEEDLPPFEERFRSMSWEEIVAEAEGQTV